MKQIVDSVGEQTFPFSSSHATIEICLATQEDRTAIYRLRHEVYAQELGQHQVQVDGELHDEIDAWNVYIVARVEGLIAGFISVTPPGNPSYSVEKYFPRETLPFPVNEGLFEIRLLTVLRKHRGRVPLDVCRTSLCGVARWLANRRHRPPAGGRNVHAQWTKATRPAGELRRGHV